MLSIKITPRAKTDLQFIDKYNSETWGDAQADLYLGQLESGILQLATHSELGSDCSHIRTAYRQIHIEHHDIYYQVVDSVILVIRVLHESMDAPRRLFE